MAWCDAGAVSPFPAFENGSWVPLLGELLGDPHSWNVFLRVTVQDATAEVVCQS